MLNTILLYNVKYKETNYSTFSCTCTVYIYIYKILHSVYCAVHTYIYMYIYIVFINTYENYMILFSQVSTV